MIKLKKHHSFQKKTVIKHQAVQPKIKRNLKRNKYLKRIHWLTLSIFIVCCLGFSSGLFLILKTNFSQQVFASFPIIKTINCTQPNSEPCHSQWERVLSSLLNRPAFSDHHYELTKNQLQQFAGSLKYCQFIWPDQLNCMIEELSIEYAFKLDDHKIGVLPNREMVFLDNQQPINVHFEVNNSILNIDTNNQVAQLVPEWLNNSLLALNSFFSTQFNYQVKIISPIELQLSLDQSSMIFILNPQEILTDLAKLQVIIASNQYQNWSSEEGSIDLRLKLPVLRRNE